MTFNELNIAQPILKAVGEIGYDTPTPIQQQAIPVVMAGKDIFGIAQTGTGKTAAFAIPIIQQLMEAKARREAELRRQTEAEVLQAAAQVKAGLQSPGTGSSEGSTELSGNSSHADTEGDTEAVMSADETQGGRHGRQGRDRSFRRERRGRNHGKAREKTPIQALILTPTRELAMQISDCFTDYGKYTGLRHTVIFGGVKHRPQTEKLNRGVDILIATPGRLLDFIGQKIISLDSISHFVLDEADRMLDMGFIADIRRLLPLLPKKRQTLFFSATMPPDIVALSRTILNKPERIEVTPVSSAVDTIEQCVYFVEKPEKKGLLISVLRKEKDKSVLIFSRTKHGADNISRTLRKAGIQSEAIHGDKSQGQRQKALDNFKSGRVKVMVATDIAARGIDIKELQLVINYDLPDVAETYVHRIGRTGRAGHSGKALTFCSQDQHMMVRDIQHLTGKKLDMVLHE